MVSDALTLFVLSALYTIGSVSVLVTTWLWLKIRHLRRNWSLVALRLKMQYRRSMELSIAVLAGTSVGLAILHFVR